MSIVFDGYPHGVGAFSGDHPRVRQPGPGEPDSAEPFCGSIRVEPPVVTASDPPDQPLPCYSVESYTRSVRPLTAAMVTVARRILGDEVQAWDAVQEALIALWNEGEMPPNPRAWLTRAVVLRSLHLARCRTRRRRHERRASERRPEASDRDDPTSRMEYGELAQAVDETLRSLPPEYREVTLLRTVAHMDYAAIAETLQIPIGTVRSRLNRTRQVFREALSRMTFPRASTTREQI